MSRGRAEADGEGPGGGARPTVATFVAHEPLGAAGDLITLGEEEAHHMRVRRLEVGAPVALRDGQGRSAAGQLVRLAKSHASVELSSVREHERPAPVHLLVPVADRDRMLWLAEKATELAVASWRPVVWRRSRSVGGRGEGTDFQRKVRARMRAALAQCDGTWLPEVFPEADLERAAASAPAGLRLVLDPDGVPVAELPADPAGATVAVGPEGGIEAAELALLVAAGFRPAALPGNILRFETAGIVGAALARVLLDRATAGDRPTTP